MKVYVILLLAILSSGIRLVGQDCSDFHQYHCVYADYTFFYSRQSKSAIMQKGQTSALKMVAYGGEEYYVAVCAHRKLGEVQFKILEDNSERTVIYDNANNEFAPSIIFSNEVTRNLIIEVTVPKGSGNEKDKRCLGVLIQFKETGTE